jgi:hypothetical protein
MHQQSCVKERIAAADAQCIAAWNRRSSAYSELDKACDKMSSDEPSPEKSWYCECSAQCNYADIEVAVAGIERIRAYMGCHHEYNRWTPDKSVKEIIKLQHWIEEQRLRAEWNIAQKGYIDAVNSGDQEEIARTDSEWWHAQDRYQGVVRYINREYSRQEERGCDRSRSRSPRKVLSNGTDVLNEAFIESLRGLSITG